MGAMGVYVFLVYRMNKMSKEGVKKSDKYQLCHVFLKYTAHTDTHL